ncbi:hypothetical protein BSL78_28569 [Apostichopus japonicus]|uniref:Uncharacterized protein n=1 Tax=Stichopus japonicus TaxID=307972 RepID=A0A2G8JFR9_STIJA|nr:hypothetical protein BSL78_28569 [Apostichopus japonicus]
MPRYGAKTYGGKGHRKDDKNNQFDEVWAKSQGSKIAPPEFSPVKPSPVKAEESPARKSSRLTRNSSTEVKTPPDVDGSSRSRRTPVISAKNKSKSSASNLDDNKDSKGKKQATILNTLPKWRALLCKVPRKKNSAAISHHKRTGDKPVDSLVVKRKSRDLRTNGDLKAIPETSKSSDDNFDFEEPSDAKVGSQTESKTDLRAKKTLQVVGKKVAVDNKDEFEFDFDEGLADNASTKRSSSLVSEAGRPRNQAGIVKARSKELTGITRRIFNSPKKSPVKARSMQGRGQCLTTWKLMR